MLRDFLNGFYNFYYAVEDWRLLIKSRFSCWKIYYKSRFYSSLNGDWNALEKILED
jgi:hypothetical protein